MRWREGSEQYAAEMAVRRHLATITVVTARLWQIQFWPERACWRRVARSNARPGASRCASWRVYERGGAVGKESSADPTDVFQLCCGWFQPTWPSSIDCTHYIERYFCANACDSTRHKNYLTCDEKLNGSGRNNQKRETINTPVVRESILMVPTVCGRWEFV